MKRIIIIIAALVMFIVPACAEINLSDLSFDELRELQTQISKELTTRPEWKSVPVPPGFYKIGRDIPAGEWTITCGESSYDFISIECGANANESGTRVKPGKGWEFGVMVSKPGKGQGKSQESLTVNLLDGYYIRIEYGQAIFSTPERIDLGF